MPRRTLLTVALAAALLLVHLPGMAGAALVQDAGFMSGSSENTAIDTAGRLALKGTGIERDSLAVGGLTYAAISTSGASWHEVPYFASSSVWGTGLVDVDAAGCTAWGVTASGTVLMSYGTSDMTSRPYKYYSKRDVYGWTDIVALDVYDLALGLRKDGSVVVDGSKANSLVPDSFNPSAQSPDDRWEVGEWTEIVDIAVNKQGTYGLRADGTVVGNEIRVYSNAVLPVDESRCYWATWKDIVDIESVTDQGVVGLTKDGRVKYSHSGHDGLGPSSEWRREIATWTDIVDVEFLHFGPLTVVGLRSDGTLLTVSDPRYNTRARHAELSSWHDVVALDSNSRCLVGLREDGAVYRTGLPVFPALEARSDISTSTRLNSGSYDSVTFDTGTKSILDSVSWEASVPAGCSLKFQMASNNSDGVWDYVGPDGTANTYYDTSGQAVWQGHAGDRYVRYRAYMTSNSRLSPVLSSVEIAHHPYDLTPPVTSVSFAGEAGDEGWYRSAVIVSFAAVDDGSGVAATEYSLDGGASWSAYTTPFNLSAEGMTYLMYRSADIAGNVEQANVTEVCIDSIAPTVNFSSPTQGAIVAPNTPLTCQWSATDSGSGVARSTGPVSGAALDTSALGDHEVIVSVVDAAGNVGTASTSYSVRYPLLNPTAPLQSRALATGVVKGSVLAIRIDMAGYDPSWPTPAATMYVAPVASDGSVGARVPAPSNNGTSGAFRFDPTGPALQFNLSTKTLGTGQWELTAVMSDGARYSARLLVVGK